MLNFSYSRLEQSYRLPGKRSDGCRRRLLRRGGHQRNKAWFWVSPCIITIGDNIIGNRDFPRIQIY
jgi:hypothetical protein